MKRKKKKQGIRELQKLRPSRRSKNVVLRAKETSRSLALIPKNERQNIVAIKTRKPNSMQNAIQARIKELGAIDRRQAALELRLQGIAEYDIAKALGVTQSAVSQMLGKVLAQKTESIRLMGDDLRTLELERCDRMIFHWYLPARKDPRSADVLLHWVERRHKISGMEISRSDIRVNDLRVSAGDLDLKKLEAHPDAERLFKNMEELWAVAGPTLPEDEPSKGFGKKGRTLEHDE